MGLNNILDHHNANLGRVQTRQPTLIDVVLSIKHRIVVFVNWKVKTYDWDTRFRVVFHFLYHIAQNGGNSLLHLILRTLWYM